MKWTKELEERFTELRQRELGGMLNEAEEFELIELMAMLETGEATQFVNVIAHLNAEQAMLRARLQTSQTDNENLAKVLNQQEQLVADARKWLVEFEKRHTMIQQSYTRLTGEVLVHS